MNTPADFSPFEADPLLKSLLNASLAFASVPPPSQLERIVNSILAGATYGAAGGKYPFGRPSDQLADQVVELAKLIQARIRSLETH